MPKRQPPHPQRSPRLRPHQQAIDPAWIERLPGESTKNPLDLGQSLREAAEDVVRLVPDLAHIEVDAVQFAMFHSRSAERVFNYARCYPLEATRRVGKRWFRLETTYTPAQVEARYILAFALPRYFEMPPRARLETLLHELYHIGPNFDGSARSFERGRHHGPSKSWFDEQVRTLSATYLPKDLEWQHHALFIQLQAGMHLRYQRLVRPQYVEIGSGL
jgi:predicted metallopeptidase